VAEFLSTAGLWIGWAAVGLICIAGILLSCLTLSGTWLVALAAIIAALLSHTAFPGAVTIVIFIAVCIAVEVIESVAGSIAVTKRGGSKAGGLAAFVGGLAGLFLGGFIPVPIVGSLLGMLACSFGLTYLVEWCRLKATDSATHIARGALMARVFVVCLKVATTLGMIAYLAIGSLVD